MMLRAGGLCPRGRTYLRTSFLSLMFATLGRVIQLLPSEHFPCCWVSRQCRVVAFSLRKTPIDTEALHDTYRKNAPALRAQIGPDEAEAEGCGGSTVKADNEEWAK